MAKDQMIRRETQLRNDGKLDAYNREITNLVERGVLKVLSPEETERAPIDSSWYSNHHMVERPDKNSTKLRIVFNSASTYKGVCVNDALEKGPDYTNSLFTCFLR